MAKVAYRKRIIDQVMLNIKKLPSLETRWSVRGEADSEKMLQMMRVNSISISSISTETDENHIHF